MRKDFFVIVGIGRVDEMAHVLDVIENREEAMARAKIHEEFYRGITVYQLASREEIGIEDRI